MWESSSLNWMNGFKDLDRALSPSMHSHLGSPDFVIQKHLSFIKEGSRNARENLDVLHHKGAGSACLVDIYTRRGLERRPKTCVVFVHGGYWEMLSKEDSAYLAQSFVRTQSSEGDEKETAFAAVGYTLSPNASINQMVSQVAAALTSLVHTYEFEISVMGHSAGAQLAFMAYMDANASDPSQEYIASHKELLIQKTRHLALISGIHDLVPIIPSSYNTHLKLNHETAVSLSPLHVSDAMLFPTKTVPILIAYAEHDPPLFKEQSLRFSARLMRSNANVRLVEVKDKDHFSVMEDLVDAAHPIRAAFLCL